MKKRGRIENLKFIPKGTVMNPKGRPPLIARELKKLTLEELREIIELAVRSNTNKLRVLIKDPTTPALQMGVATSLLRAIQKGDWNTLEAIVSRIVGKIPDRVQVDGPIQIAAVDVREVRMAMKKLEDEI